MCLKIEILIIIIISLTSINVNVYNLCFDVYANVR